jgi:hypothetical protein
MAFVGSGLALLLDPLQFANVFKELAADRTYLTVTTETLEGCQHVFGLGRQQAIEVPSHSKSFT